MLKLSWIARGFSLTELMVVIAIGMLLSGSVISIYARTVSNNSDALASSRLQQVLRASLSIMRADIRRAGYWGNAVSNLGANNPFTVAGTNLQILDGGSCVLYSYDLDKDGVVDVDSEYFGFRLNTDVIEMRIAGATTTDCHVASSEWQAITDAASITVSALTFDLSASVCTNLSDPTDINCAAPSIGDVTQTIRQLAINLTGYLSAKPEISRTQDASIRIRNDLIKVN